MSKVRRSLGLTFRGENTKPCSCVKEMLESIDWMALREGIFSLDVNVPLFV